MILQPNLDKGNIEWVKINDNKLRSISWYSYNLIGLVVIEAVGYFYGWRITIVNKIKFRIYFINYSTFIAEDEKIIGIVTPTMTTNSTLIQPQLLKKS